MIFMVTVFSRGVIDGATEGVGEIRRLPCVFNVGSIYSSKVSVIVLSLNPFVKLGGLAFNRTGGSESLGPPEGGIILAQPEVNTSIFRMKRIRIIYSKDFFMNNSR